MVVTPNLHYVVGSQQNHVIALTEEAKMSCTDPSKSTVAIKGSKLSNFFRGIKKFIILTCNIEVPKILSGILTIQSCMHNIKRETLCIYITCKN